MTRKFVICALFLCVLLVVPMSAYAEDDGYGACTIRNAHSSLVGYNAPDIGNGYVKYNLRGDSYGELEAQCTDAIYEELMKLYCSCAPNASEAQWGVAEYNSVGDCAFIDNGDTCTSGCAASGCNYHTCAGVASVACPASIDSLLTYVGAIGIHEGIKNSLLAKLKNAQSDLTSGDKGAACDLLTAFSNQVAAQSGKKISVADANRLIADAAAVQDELGCFTSN